MKLNKVPLTPKARAATWLATLSALFAFSGGTAVRADSKDDEIAKLKAQIAEQKAEIAALRKKPKEKAAAQASPPAAKPLQSTHAIAGKGMIKAAVTGDFSEEEKKLVQKGLKAIGAKEDPKEQQKAREQLDADMLKMVDQTKKPTNPKLFLIHRNVLPAAREPSNQELDLGDKGHTIFETHGYLTGKLLGIKRGDGTVDPSRVQKDNNTTFGRFFDTLGGLTQSDRERVHWGSIGNSIRIRESLDNIKAFQMTVNEDILAAGGSPADAVFAISNAEVQDKESDFASFKYTNNRLTNKAGWNAKGVIYLPMTLVSEEGQPMSPFNLFDSAGVHSNWAIFYPAIRFERDTSKDNTKSPLNTLDFLIGADFNFYKGDPTLPYGGTGDGSRDGADLSHFNYVIHMAAGAHSNFNFDKVKPLYELTYTPVVDKLNAYQTKPVETGDGTEPGGLLYKIILQATGVVTQNVNDTQNGKAGDTTMPLGFDAGLGLRLDTGSNFWDKTELKAHYQGQWDTKQDSKFSGLFTASLILPTITDETSESALSIDYRNGHDLTTFEKVDEIAVTYKVKF